MKESLMAQLGADRPLFRDRGTYVPSLLWLWLPLAYVAATLALWMIDEQTFRWWMIDEVTGVSENLTAILFLVSAVMAFRLAWSPAAGGLTLLRIVAVILGVMFFFVAGEEISWGQHLFGWQTPDWMAELNKQRETNLHNMAERALDQKPRAIASILIVLGGALVPLWISRRGMPAFLERWPALAWLVPTGMMIPASLLVVLPRVFDRLQVWFDTSLPPPFDIPTRYHQELQETQIALVIFLYLLNLVLRVRRLNKDGPLPA